MDNKFGNDKFKEVIQRFNGSAVREALNNIAEAIKPAEEKAKQMSEQMKLMEIANKEKWDKITEILSEASKNLKYSIESIDDFKSVCFLLGYPPHNDITLPEVNYIAKIYQEVGGSLAEIEPIIEDFYVEKYNIDYIRKRLYGKWTKSGLLNKRLDLIEQSITCFEEELYFAAIPLLFSQFEGMVADGNDHNGYMGGQKLNDYIEKTFDSKSDFSLDDELYKFYSSILVVPFEHGKPLKSFLSRHAIMHGGDVEYGTKVNYIKLILFFDSVHDRLVKKQRKSE